MQTGALPAIFAEPRTFAWFRAGNWVSLPYASFSATRF
jgi:hypothetical protein